MKIEKIELYQLDLPYAGGVYRLSGGRTYESFDASIVRITCDDGTVGWGESTPFGSTYIAAHALGTRAGIVELAPALLGRDPRHADRIADAMDSILAGHQHAKTPLDVACWDAFGRSVGLLVYALLGGSTDIPLPMISSIHAGDPDEMRERVAEHRAKGATGAIRSRSGPLTARAGPHSTPNASSRAWPTAARASSSSPTRTARQPQHGCWWFRLEGGVTSLGGAAAGWRGSPSSTTS